MRVLIALGGNALLRRGEAPDAAIQLDHVLHVAPAMAAAAAEHELVITHGNGPQVGLLALESSDDRSLERPYRSTPWWPRPGADRLLAPAVDRRRRARPPDRQPRLADGGVGRRPQFRGPDQVRRCHLQPRAGRQAGRAAGWVVKPDGDRWRRVVASPAPVGIVEVPVVETLLASGTTVICAGGGGAAVVRSGDGWTGVEAVVDKDHVAALLRPWCCRRTSSSSSPTSPAVVAGYGTPGCHILGAVTVDELEGQSRRRVDGPKVEAACRFARESGKVAVIGALERTWRTCWPAMAARA